MRTAFVLFVLQACCQRLALSSASNTNTLMGVSDYCSYSSLWGETGEKYSAASRLPDFSRAGYFQGDRALPVLEPGNLNTSNWFNVKIFGAKGDTQILGPNKWSGTDDYPAVQKALDTLKDGSVLYFPAGRYTLGRNFTVTKQISLKGDGMGKTVLYFPKSLADLYGRKTRASTTRKECVKKTQLQGSYSVYTFEYGLLVYEGVDAVGKHPSFSPLMRKTQLAKVTSNAAKGTTLLNVDSTEKLAPGMWVRVAASDFPKGHPQSGQLIQALYGGFSDRLGDSFCDLIGSIWPLSIQAKVQAVIGANQVQLDRALPMALDVVKFKDVEIHTFAPSIQNAGISDLTIRMKSSKYGKHFQDKGYNGIVMKNCSNMWIQNVEVVNADNSIVLENVHFSTLDGIVLSSDYPRNGVNGKDGHHGVWLNELSSNNVVQNFNIKIKAYHDLMLETFVHSNVLKNGQGKDINLEHHRRGPWNNLFSNIQLGKATSEGGFHSGGQPNIRGAPSGMGNAYWNIKADAVIKTPPTNFGPKLTFVGVQFSSDVKTTGWKYDWWVEESGDIPVCPTDLHAAMKTALRQKV